MKNYSFTAAVKLASRDVDPAAYDNKLSSNAAAKSRAQDISDKTFVQGQM